MELTRDLLLPRLEIRRRLRVLALHPTCSSVRSGTASATDAVAAAIADEVVVPTSWRCCGFAGDRGLMYPELTAAATSQQAGELLTWEVSASASTNRTCELAMTRATGRPYRHLLELVEEATR